MSDAPQYAYPPRFFPVDEAARYLGVSANTFRALGIVPMNIGRRILWDRNSLDLYADQLAGKPLSAPDRARASSDIEAAFLKRYKRG